MLSLRSISLAAVISFANDWITFPGEMLRKLSMTFWMIASLSDSLSELLPLCNFTIP